MGIHNSQLQEGALIPTADGEINRYVNEEARRQHRRFDSERTVIFINGMGNSGEDHARSALALSLLQMSTVVGVYNRATGFAGDLVQCVFDKNQFDGVSLSAPKSVAVRRLLSGKTSVEVARDALSRNPAARAAFDLIRRPEHLRSPIFAHSQGNLILSNALQALVAVDGPEVLRHRVVHTFGSPAANWPQGVHKIEHGFTWDPVTWLAGFDPTISISKVGWPAGSHSPFAHGFLEYLKNDAEFVVNRYRIGGLGITLQLDERGLAECLIAVGSNLGRVVEVFDHLDREHNRNADDVARHYVRMLRGEPRARAIVAALRTDHRLLDLLVKMFDEGWTTGEEKQMMEFLQNIRRG